MPVRVDSVGFEAPVSKTEPDEQAGIQSIETGARVLAALADLTATGALPTLKVLAETAGMPPAKAHRYIVSFLRTEQVERDPVSGRYRLGPLSRQVGISALMGIDLVRIGGAMLPYIRDSLSETTALAIWGSHGPTIVRIEEYRRTIMVSTRVGEVLPILRSATGIVFGTWMPRSVTLPLITSEIAEVRARRDRGAVTSLAAAERLFEETRSLGAGRIIGGLSSGVNAVAAPVFDYTGSLAGVLLSLGPAEVFDATPTGPLFENVKRFAEQISIEMGSARSRTPNGRDPR